MGVKFNSSLNFYNKLLREHVYSCESLCWNATVFIRNLTAPRYIVLRSLCNSRTLSRVFGRPEIENNKEKRERKKPIVAFTVIMLCKMLSFSGTANILHESFIPSLLCCFNFSFIK